MTGAAPPRYRFADIEVDPGAGCLRRGGADVHLRHKAFQVLVYLLEHRQRLVTKQELFDTIWRDVAVTEDAIVQCVGDIRKAMGDDPRAPRFIRTLPRAGYRFIGVLEEQAPTVPVVDAPVHRLDEVPAAPPAADVAAHTAGWRPRVGWRALAAAVVLTMAGAVLLAALAFRESEAEGVLARLPGRKGVAVMHLENRSGDRDLEWWREGLADMLITNLSRSDQLHVLSRQQMAVLLKRLGPDGRVADSSAALDLTRRARADVLVSGSFGRAGDRIRIDVQLLDAATGGLIAADGRTLASESDVLGQMDALSLTLLTHLGASLPPRAAGYGLTAVSTDNPEAYRYYSLALEKAQAYHNAEAIALFEKAIQADPRFAMAYAGIGYAYAVTWNRPEEARPYLEKAATLSDRLTEQHRLYLRAWYAMAHMDAEAAVRALRDITERYPTEIEAYDRLGTMLVGELQYDEAIATFKRGLAIDPDAPALFNGLGNAFSMAGRHEEAIAARQRYAALAPNEPNAHDSVGLAFEWAGRYPEALAAYDRALALNPRFDVARAHRGNLFARLGRYRDAIQEFRTYIDVAPSEGERIRGRGSIGRLYLRMGRLREAAQYVGDDELVRLALALERGDFEAGDRAARDIVPAVWARGARLFPRQHPYLRGVLALRHGRTEEALAAFRKVLTLQPVIWDLDPLEDCLARAYLELQRFDEAVVELRRVLALNPNDALSRYRLGLAYEGQHRPADALAEYRRFLAIWKDADADIPELVDARRRAARLTNVTSRRTT